MHMLYTSNTFVSYNYSLEEADVIFLGIPFVSTSLSKPALYGPLMVRESLKIKEGFQKDLGKDIFSELKVCDLGDLEIVPGSYELTAKRIRETISDIKTINKKAFLIFIGGEHLITLPIVESLKPKTILQLDAHGDCRPDYLGNPYMHQTWAYHASKLAKIIQIGVQTRSKEEISTVEKHDIVDFKGIISKNKKLPKFNQPLHMTIDIDIIHGTETGFPEGLLHPEDVYNIVKNVKCASIDITEIADYKLPSKTGFIAAQIITIAMASLI